MDWYFASRLPPFGCSERPLMNSNLNYYSWSIDDIDILLFMLSLVKNDIPLRNCMHVIYELRRAQVLHV